MRAVAALRPVASRGVGGASRHLWTKSSVLQQESTDYAHTKDMFDFQFTRRPIEEAMKVGELIKLNRLEVTPEQAASFWEKGYFLHPKPLIDAPTIAILRKEFERLFRGEIDYNTVPQEFEYWRKAVAEHRAGSPNVRKINNAWWLNAAIRRVVTANALGYLGCGLLKCKEVRLWHDQAIVKPPTPSHAADAGNIGWHQDYAFWRASSSRTMITAFIVLQDTDMNNGGLRTITGSHRWGLQKDSNTFFEKDMDALKKKFAIASGGLPWEDEPCVMKAGQVAFHHSLTFHGSGPNHSDQNRLALAVHMQSELCKYRPGYWHSNVRELGPKAKSFQAFEGDAFPVLWKRPPNPTQPQHNQAAEEENA